MAKLSSKEQVMWELIRLREDLDYYSAERTECRRSDSRAATVALLVLSGWLPLIVLSALVGEISAGTAILWVLASIGAGAAWDFVRFELSEPALARRVHRRFCQLQVELEALQRSCPAGAGSSEACERSHTSSSAADNPAS